MASPRVYPVLSSEQTKLFWAKVDTGPASQCWPWTAAKKGRGYGALRVNDQPLLAHRVAWELVHGPVAVDKVVYQVFCNNPACCNVAHMTVGTRSEAMAAAAAHGTKLGRATHDPEGPEPRVQYAKPYPDLTPKQLAAFWAKVDKRGDDECWHWTGAAGGNYGAFKAGGRQLRATRVSYKLAFGEPPLDIDVCHRCDNPPCVNPAHLFLGTRRDNANDAKNKGRGNQARGVAHGKAKLTPEQVYEIRRRGDAGGPNGSRELMGIEFGVNPVTVSNIVTRKIWKHLPEIASNCAVVASSTPSSCP